MGRVLARRHRGRNRLARVLAPAARDRIVEIRAADPDAQAELVVYADARHAFDHPMLGWIGKLPAGGQMPRECLIVEGPPRMFVERKTGLMGTSESLGRVLAGCAVEGGTAGGDPEAARAAMDRTIAFLSAALRAGA